MHKLILILLTAVAVLAAGCERRFHSEPPIVRVKMEPPTVKLDPSLKVGDWSHKDYSLPNGEVMFRETTIQGHTYFIRGSETMFHAEHCTNHYRPKWVTSDSAIKYVD